MTSEEELLARLGTPTCVFCGGLKRGPERDWLQVFDLKGSIISGSSCSEICERDILDRNRLYMEKMRDRMLRDIDTACDTFKEYRRAQHDHGDDLNEAMNSWAMGNGLFGPVRD